MALYGAAQSDRDLNMLRVKMAKTRETIELRRPSPCEASFEQYVAWQVSIWTCAHEAHPVHGDVLEYGWK